MSKRQHLKPRDVMLDSDLVASLNEDNSWSKLTRLRLALVLAVADVPRRSLQGRQLALGGASDEARRDPRGYRGMGGEGDWYISRPLSRPKSRSKVALTTQCQVFFLCLPLQYLPMEQAGELKRQG